VVDSEAMDDLERLQQLLHNRPNTFEKIEKGDRLANPLKKTPRQKWHHKTDVIVGLK
jgi:hypothetical protein